MKFVITLFALLAFYSGAVLAQGCGPNCPACSGAGSSESGLISQNSLMASALAIPDADEERMVMNLRYGILDWLDAGAGYAARTEEFIWNVRIQPLFEKKGDWQPGLILGTGSVQIGGSDQSLYGQLIKSIDLTGDLNLSLAAGAATLLPDFDETYGLAGVTANIVGGYGLFVSYDGESYHEGISWSVLENLTFSFLMIESENPALSASVQF